jgi:hypothetical protein
VACGRHVLTLVLVGRGERYLFGIEQELVLAIAPSVWDPDLALVKLDRVKGQSVGPEGTSGTHLAGCAQ